MGRGKDSKGRRFRSSKKIRRPPDPSRAVIAQRNHGLVITGPSLPEIFARIEGGLIEISHEIPQR